MDNLNNGLQRERTIPVDDFKYDNNKTFTRR